MNDRSRLPEIASFVFILGLALVLRVGWPEITEFKRDEANLSILALDFANGRVFPLLGIASSVGFPNAPFNVYLLGIPYFFSSSPVLATQFIGLLNVLAVVLTYIFLRRHVNVWVALGVMLLFAVSPWSLIFSRKIWAQNMLPLFVVATILTGIWAFVDKKRSSHVAHPALLVITGQIHYGAFVIIPACAALWWYGRRTISRYTAFGVLLALILLLPYIVGLAQSGALSFDGRLERISGDAETSAMLTSAPVREMLVLIAGTEIHALAGEEAFRDYLAQVPAVYPLLNFLGYLLIASVVWLVFKAVTRRYDRRIVDIVALLWLIFPIAIYATGLITFYIHYLIPTIPAGFIIIGFTLDDIRRSLSDKPQLLNGAKLAGGIGLAIFSALHLLLFVNLLNFLYYNATPNAFGEPLGYLIQVRDAVLEENPQYVVGRFDGLALEFDEQPTVFYALLYDVPHVRFEDRDRLVYRDEPTLVITTDYQTDCISTRTDNPCYRIYWRDGRSIPDDLVTSFENGVDIMSYHWRNDDYCVDIRWRINVSADREYNFAVHGFDAQDERIAIADSLSWPARYWRGGDVVSQTFCLGVPVDYIMLGMYHIRPDNTLDVVNQRDDFETMTRLNVE
ncbi:MAG: hypothetical protein EA396_14025 [Anaerolineaceae bacterium]|nr:MAG: hypothetical protein EA396_14025 [Anaerolineaceae bacterium]